MENLQVQGVYKITNKINNKFYIGSSVNIKNRWKQHKSKLKNSTHPSKDMINDYTEYGVKSFEIEILEIVLKQEDLNNREQYWMEFYDIATNSYNTCLVAGSTKGLTPSKDTKEKLSQSLKGKNSYKRSTEVKLKMSQSKTGLTNLNKRKPVVQFDKEGNLIKEWSSVTEVCEIFDWYENALRKACNGSRKTYKGYIWKYKINQGDD